MAAFQIPPWLNPPDIIGAAARGASIGAELRGQDIQQASAADRLRAAYDQLALKEQYANERAADRQALMSQGLEIRRQALENQAQRNADLAQYQQGLLSERGKSDEARARSAAELLGLKQQGLENQAQRIKDLQDAAATNADLRRQALEQGAQRIKDLREYRGSKLSEPEKALMGADVSELKGLEKQIGSTEEHGFGLFHPFGGNKSQMDALRKRAADLREHIATQYGGKSGLESAPMNPRDRVSGTTYQTPKGPHTWTGSGWMVPDTSDEEDQNAE